MSNLHPLFDQILEPFRPPSPVDRYPREQVRKAAFAKADAAFLERYTAVLTEYAANHADFTASEITAVHEAKHGLIAQHNAKALGGLYGQLQKMGKIRRTGEYRHRKNGNIACTYERVGREQI